MKTTKISSEDHAVKMTDSTSAQAQQKFTNLRKRLDQLGYRQTLGLESLPLVEKLFADLVHTTESLKNTKLELGKKETKDENFDTAIEPYKSDNAKLVKETNDLHQQLIKQKEEADAIVRELKASLRKLEHENADLKFLNNQYVHKTRQLEKESKEKTDKILTLQEKNFHAVVQTPGGKKKSIPFRRQRMEIDTTVPPSDGPSKPVVPPPDDPYVADLLQVADSRISELEAQVRKVNDEKEVMDRKLKNFRQQVEGRDEEIDRLNRMLDGGRPSDVVALEARNRANERMISHLNIQDELEKSRHELEDLDMSVAQLKAENNRISKDYNDTKAQLSVKKGDLLRLEELLDRVTEDKKRLSHRVNKLTANEKELVLEIERLKRKNGPGMTKKGKTPSKLDAFIRSIEEERNYYRDQADALQKMLRGEIPTRSRSPVRSRPTSRSGSPVRDTSSTKSDKTVAQYETIIRVLEEEKEYYKKEYEMLKAVKKSSSSARSTPTKSLFDQSETSKLIRERDEMRALLDKFERHMAEIQANVKVLTAERDKLSTMYEETNSELQKVRRELVRSPKSPKTSLAAQAVLRRVENERDDAIADLRRMTTERDSLRERLKIATETSLSDRAKLEQKIEDLENTLHALKNKLIFCVNFRMVAEETEKSLEDAQKRLARKENDIQAQEEKICHLEDRLAELNRVSQMSREEISQLRSTITSLDREKDSLQHAIDQKTEKCAGLNEDILYKEKTLSDLKIRVSELEAQLEHASENLNLKDREQKSLKRQLDGTSEDLAETSRSKDVALRENRRLQDDLSVMTRENQKVSQELQDALEEKESLRIQVQEYMLEIKRVEDMLARKEQERSDMLDQYRALSVEAEQYQTSTHQLESEGSNLRLELMTKDSELRRNRDKIENLEKEIQEHLNAQQAYELQVSNLTRSVAHLEENFRKTEEDKQNLLADVTAVRELCAKLEGSKESLQRQLTSSALDKEQMQTLIDDMRQETELLKSQLTSERTSLKNLEGVLQNNREKEFQTQLSAQERNAELQMLKDRLSLNESKIQSQGREIASLRTRNVELEGDVERLRRNLTSEKFERYRSPDTSYLNTSEHRTRTPDRYLDNDLDTSPKGLGSDVL
ncbi:hypothetical protein KUTeg_025038 [Tegillarca granosa]|uniref:Centrosomal protein of 135 kDa n=1 Tax=Tegillarca granosa TaxID=220873 RepID=A0ABQ9DZQ8_TEGGR|nr:hypothetical protein KUTeg_025038 [Tegillarca granosa]